MYTFNPRSTQQAVMRAGQRGSASPSGGPDMWTQDWQKAGGKQDDSASLSRPSYAARSTGGGRGSATRGAPSRQGGGYGGVPRHALAAGASRSKSQPAAGAALPWQVSSLPDLATHT